MLRLDSRDEIDRETPNIESIDQRNYPLANCSRIVVLLVRKNAERDSETEFNEDEHEFDPERDSEDAVLTIVDSESLILPADENCRDNVAGTDKDAISACSAL